MRIGFRVYGNLEQVSGGFIYDRALVAALAARGHSVEVIGLPWVGYARALLGGLLPGVRVLPAGAEDHDVIVEDELIHPSVVGRRTAGQSGQPGQLPRAVRTVALVHNLTSRQPRDPFARLKSFVERRYLAGVDGVIAVCRRSLDDVRASIGDSRAAVVAYPGRDHVAPHIGPSLLEARSAAAGPLRVLHVASVVPSKGLDRLLAAMARALRMTEGVDLTLDIVGHLPSSRYVDAIRRQASRLGLGPRVHFGGLLRGAALENAFRNAHVLALPSDREAYSLACLEALGFGLPVIATSVGGLSEMLADGREGHLIHPDDIAGWAQALARLAKDRSRLRTMGAAAIERYRGHATWAEVAIQVEGFLQACLAGAPARATSR